jgi:hypothetical protein
LLLFLVALGVDQGVAAQTGSVPPNDAFARAQLINATSGLVTGTTAGATVQKGEPPLAQTLKNTIWYRFAETTGRAVVFDISASRPALGSSEYALGTAYADVYYGSDLAALTKVGSIGNVMYANANRQSIEVNAPARSSYYIRVAADANGSSRDIVLQWGPPPGNDRFAFGPTLIGASGSMSGSTVGATAESGEPVFDHDSGPGISAAASVWYRWTAPQAGIAVFALTGTYPQEIQAFANTGGTTPANLVPIATSRRIDRPKGASGGELQTELANYPLAFPVQAGQSFVLRVAPRATATGTFTLNWSMGASPNDHMATNYTPFLIGPLPGLTIEASNLGATSSASDNLGAAAGSSIWFGLLPANPTGNRVTLTTAGSDVDTVMAVRAWRPQVNSIIDITYDDDSAGQGHSRVSFDLDHPAFWVVIGSKKEAQGRIRLTGVAEEPNAPPPNDSFQQAITLSGLSGRVDGAFVGATQEAGDPPTGTSTTRTVWYRWKATVSGDVRLTAITRCYPALGWSCPAANVQLFAGSTLADLRAVTPGTDSRFPVQGRVEYRILVTPGQGDTARYYRLNWVMQ